jgi:uncharacterized protein YkwD
MRTPGLLVGLATVAALAGGAAVATAAGADTAPGAATAPGADTTDGSGGADGSGQRLSDGPEMQQSVLSLVNAARRDAGCPALSVDRRLVEAARGHAEDMASNGYFAHESPWGEGAGDRVSDTGYDWKRYAENIARGQDSPYEVVNGWLNSPPHRENILDCRLAEVGVGLAFDDEHTPYWVQDFGTPHADSDN